MLPGERWNTPATAFFGYLENEGSREMAINGDGNEKRFELLFPISRQYLKILNIKLNISGGKIDDPDSFGGLNVALGVGKELETGFLIRNDDLLTEFETAKFKDNWEMVQGSSGSHPWGFTNAGKDVMIVEFYKDYDLVIDVHKYAGFYVWVRADFTDITSMTCVVRAHYV